MNHEILTVDEVCDFLRVGVETLQREIDAGRLPAITIGGECRFMRSDLLSFLETAKTTGRPQAGTSKHGPLTKGEPQFELTLKTTAPFYYSWPGNREHYDEAYSGTLQVGNEPMTVQIGFTNREAAGKDRRRAIVFVDGYPTVEFVAADDFEQSKTMVSLIKRENGKQVRRAEPLPAQYESFRVEPYRNHVTGPYTSTNLAVVCRSGDHKTMVAHALARLRAREAGA